MSTDLEDAPRIYIIHTSLHSLRSGARVGIVPVPFGVLYGAVCLILAYDRASRNGVTITFRYALGFIILCTAVSLAFGAALFFLVISQQVHIRRFLGFWFRGAPFNGLRSRDRKRAVHFSRGRTSKRDARGEMIAVFQESNAENFVTETYSVIDVAPGRECLARSMREEVVLGSLASLRARHWSGLPKEYARSDFYKCGQRLLLPAERVQLWQSVDSWWLDRWSAGGAYAGRTWHESEYSARAQLTWEYADAIKIDRPDRPTTAC